MFTILVPAYLGYFTMQATIDLLKQMFVIKDRAYNPMCGLVYVVEATHDEIVNFCEATGAEEYI